MQENIRNKLKLTLHITNVLLLFIAAFISFLVVSFNNQESVATVARFNGTVYAGNQQSNKVTLMINVYWGDDHLESMLNTLKEYNMKTTFFVGGSWANSNPTLLRRIYNEGHEIGSHGMTHKDHDKLDYNGNYKEIETCHKVVESILGLEMRLFAPPSGYYNKYTTQAAEALGYTTIMWTRDTIDWRDRDTNVIYSRAINNMKGGDLILMHPTKETAEALPKILDFIKNNNFELTTVSDNISDE